MPRRRRSSKAAAFEEDERSLFLRVLLHSPKDTFAGAMAFALVAAIIANALFLQAGRHPAPMFGSVATPHAGGATPANPAPRSHAAEAEDSKPAEAKPAADPLANFVKTTGATPAAPAVIPRPPASIPVTHSEPGSHRIAAVQRALTEYGYGQLKPTGVAGPDTLAAIQKFERARKLPVTGQVSDRLVRELTAMIGHPIE
jgi:hypothetical protein